MTENIAVIGAHGQLGNDLVKLFVVEKNITTFPLSHHDIEITNPKSIADAFATINPDVVINAAAYNKVDQAEQENLQAFLVNGIANKYLAQYCEENKKIFVTISSDYVFGADTDRKNPYTETDLAGPINTYGISKLAGEYFATYCSRHFVIRTCGLFGTSNNSGKGYNFVELMLKLAKEKGHVKVVNDQFITPTYTHDLAKQIMLLIKTNNFGLYHATSEGKCSWYEYAKEIFALTKTDALLTAVSTQTFSTAAKRPHYSVLENEKLKKMGINILPTWQEGLKKYLIEKRYITPIET